MKNVEHFGDLTPRMNEFKEQVLDKKPYISAQRAVLATEAYKANQNQPSVMKRALMLKNILLFRQGSLCDVVLEKVEVSPVGSS